MTGTQAASTPEPLVLEIPEVSLVLLVGISGSGKSTFARRHFAPTEVLSSDVFRGMVADDQNDQSATPAAFDALHYVAAKRLAAGRLTVVDATNVQPESRRQLIRLAREHDCLAAAIVLDVDQRECRRRNQSRPDRDFGPHVLRRQHDQLRRGLRGLAKEGFRAVHVVAGADLERVEVRRTRLYSDLRHLTGPFDVIGDVHGCRAELEQLLGDLGYQLVRDERGRPVDAVPPPGRTAVLVGDLVDRGPDSPGVLRLVMGMVGAGHALCVAGNHDDKLSRALAGRKVQVAHGLERTLEQLDAEDVLDPEFRPRARSFLDGLISHYVLDGGRLAVAHAGVLEAYQGRASRRVRGFCLYGDTTGETDEFGLPVRYPWAREYRGQAMVLYGHTPVPEPEWVNNTMCLDTGCVFGGALTALRYPERELVSVAAQQEYYPSARPLAPAAPGRDADELALTDVLGGEATRVIETGHHGRISVRPANAAAAIEVISRFAVDPRWLVYLPPTMAPSGLWGSANPGDPVQSSVAGDAAVDGHGQAVLEHPQGAFAEYAAAGVGQVICQTKHMGSRAVVLVTRTDEDANGRPVSPFGIAGPGAIWTRTGRSFFPAGQTAALLGEFRAAARESGLFEELGSDWLLLDSEILPWSSKAEELIRNRYAATGAAANHVLPQAQRLLATAAARGLDVTGLAERFGARGEAATGFREAYRRYCWPTSGLDGVQVAVFSVLASQGAAHYERDHGWHLGRADALLRAAPQRFVQTPSLIVDTADEASRATGVAWWQAATDAGVEGMVVKPLAGHVRNERGLVQPALKVRGREYLRIIYGPDYTEPATLAGLRSRRLGHKRSLALREHALGLTALDRLAGGEPLWRVHECAFGVLALESEPVDPRL